MKTLSDLFIIGGCAVLFITIIVGLFMASVPVIIKIIGFSIIIILAGIIIKDFLKGK